MIAARTISSWKAFDRRVDMHLACEAGVSISLGREPQEMQIEIIPARVNGRQWFEQSQPSHYPPRQFLYDATLSPASRALFL